MKNLMFWKHCLACSSKSSETTEPVMGSMPAIPERKIKSFAMAACGKMGDMQVIFDVLKSFF